MLHMIACLLLVLVCTRVHGQTSLAFGSSLYSYTTYKGCVVRYSNATDVIAVPDEITQDNMVTALIVVENGPVSGKIVSPRGTILNFLIEPSQISFFRDSSSSATSATIYTSTPLFWLNNQVIYMCIYIKKPFLSPFTCASPFF